MRKYINFILWMNKHALAHENDDWCNLNCVQKGRETVRGFIVLVIYKDIFRVPWNYIFADSFNYGCDWVYNKGG